MIPEFTMASSLGTLLAKMEKRLGAVIPNQPLISLGECAGIESRFVDTAEQDTQQQLYHDKQSKYETYHVMYHSSMLAFATKLKDAETQYKRFVLYDTDWGKFEDGTDNITLGKIRVGGNGNVISQIDRPTYFKGKDLLFIASFHSNDVTMSQFHVLAHLCESLAKSLTVLLPFYPTATMERVDIHHDGSVPTASTLARLFNGLPSMGYPIRLMVYDIHTLQNRFFLTGHAVASVHTASELMRGIIERMNRQGPNLKETAIDSLAFPDAGAHKRFAKLFQPVITEENTIICEKVRGAGTKRIVTVIEGEARLKSNAIKHILIVDDILNSGGTLLECAKVLKEKSSGVTENQIKVSAYITHAIFNKAFFDSVAAGKFKIFENVYITDSIPNTITRTELGYLTNITIPRESTMHVSNDKINIKIIELASQVINDL
jgi:phosphoribosylpyrophosphate synthetase